MAIIERFQKKIIFEEAAQRAIRKDTVTNIANIYQEILGIRDIGQAKYGAPFAPLYTAKAGELIDIPRISKFFKGLTRDIKVLDFAITELENRLLFQGMEIWARTEMLKYKSDSVSKRARAEKSRINLGGLWTFVETFKSTEDLDMSQTTAWIDTSEGVAFLPASSTERAVAPQEIMVENPTTPPGGNFLGSNPSNAFDGLSSTSWRVLFPTGGQASVEARFQNPKDLATIKLDPVGFGVNVSVLVKSEREGVWREVVDSTIYRKATFPLNEVGIRAARIVFSPANNSTLAGFRDIVFDSVTSVREAKVFSNQIRSDTPFSQIKILVEGIIPPDSSVTPYFSTDAGSSWTKINHDEWLEVADSFNLVETVIPFPGGATRFGGLWQVPVTNKGVSPKNGILRSGEDQFEVAAFRKDWLEEGIMSKRLGPMDFEGEQIKTTWASIPHFSFSEDTPVVQNFGEDVATSYGVLRGDVIAFSRRTTISQYNHLNFVPLLGNIDKDLMQPNFNYRFKVWFFAARDVVVDSARFWFYQGYRKAAARTFREVGKSYGSFSIYLNNELIAGESIPTTVFSDGTSESKLGTPFIMKIIKGWNVIEYFISVTHPLDTYSDTFVEGDRYLQLSVTPCLFDPQFQLDFNLSRLLGSGEIKPSSDFDLLWNFTESPKYWGWAQDRASILFNFDPGSFGSDTIDGYFAGEMPKSTLIYSGAQHEALDLWVRLDLERATSASAGPIVSEYRILVK